MRTFLVLASVALVACGAQMEGDDSLPNVTHSTSGRGAVAPDEDARFATANGNAVPVPNVEQPGSCREGAFCDAFEAQGYMSTWHAAVTTGQALIDLGTESASLGHGSLRLTARDRSSTAYLVREHGVIASRWSGALAFSLKVSELPGEYVGGPELLVKTPDGPLSVRVSMTPEGVFLEQRGTSACLRDRCTATRTLLAPARQNHWYAIRLGFEVGAARSAPPYGVIETSVNGTDFLTHDLNVPMSDGSVFFNAGITQGDPGRPTVADLDDVSVFVR